MCLAQKALGHVVGTHHTIHTTAHCVAALELFDADSALYIILLFVLIIAFAYFYISISFNPVEVSNNLMQQGGFIPGIRPGKPTAEYIARILRKITTIGAVFLIFIAAFPMIINIISSPFPNFSPQTLPVCWQEHRTSQHDQHPRLLLSAAKY